MIGSRETAIIVTILLGGCSPYLYAPEITTFSDGVGKLRVSQQTVDTSIVAARNQAKADHARADASVFILPVECLSTGQSCIATPRPRHRPSEPSSSEAAGTALKNADPGVGAPPHLDVSAPRGCPAPTEKVATRPRADISLDVMLSALEAYSKALAAVTNAKDRAEFDVASTALATSTSALAGLMVGGPPAAGGAAIATLVIELARYGVAVSLDERRFNTLRCAVLRSQDSVGVLGLLAGALLASDVSALRAAYVDDSDAITFNMSMRPPAGKWEDNVARQQALATYIDNLRGAEPLAAAMAMVAANDALADALRKEERQAGALATVVGDFASKAGAIQHAVAAH